MVSWVLDLCFKEFFYGTLMEHETDKFFFIFCLCDCIWAWRGLFNLILMVSEVSL